MPVSGSSFEIVLLALNSFVSFDVQMPLLFVPIKIPVLLWWQRWFRLFTEQPLKGRQEITSCNGRVHNTATKEAHQISQFKCALRWSRNVRVTVPLLVCAPVFYLLVTACRSSPVRVNLCDHNNGYLLTHRDRLFVDKSLLFFVLYSGCEK